jgi:hypothetical protein
VKVKTKAELQETLHLLAIERDALRVTGNQMANVCFNLSQSVSAERLAAAKRTMTDLYKQWDEIKRVVAV